MNDFRSLGRIPKEYTRSDDEAKLAESRLAQRLRRLHGLLDEHDVLLDGDEQVRGRRRLLDRRVVVLLTVVLGVLHLDVVLRHGSLDAPGAGGGPLRRPRPRVGFSR